MMNILLSLLVLSSIYSAEFKETYVITENAALFCRHAGQGTPIIVIHGGPGLSQDYLLPYMGKLADTNEVVFYNQRGSGESSGEITAASLNVKNFMKDIEAVQNAFGFEKTTIIGHSFGGLLAMKYAITHPERVNKLILINSMAHSKANHLLTLDNWNIRMSPFMEEFNSLKNSTAFEEGDPDTHIRYYQLVFATYLHNPDLVGRLNLKMSQSAFINARKAQKIFSKELSDYDLSENLKLVSFPTLIVTGTSDITPVFIAEEIHKLIPDSRYLVIQDCGHFPYLEQPEEFFTSLTRFINDAK